MSTKLIFKVIHITIFFLVIKLSNSNLVSLYIFFKFIIEIVIN